MCSGLFSRSYIIKNSKLYVRSYVFFSYSHLYIFYANKYVEYKNWKKVKYETQYNAQNCSQEEFKRFSFKLLLQKKLLNCSNLRLKFQHNIIHFPIIMGIYLYIQSERRQ